MSNAKSELFTTVHFDSKLQWDLANAIYNDGHKKLVYFDPSMTYSSLVEKLVNVTN